VVRRLGVGLAVHEQFDTVRPRVNQAARRSVLAEPEATEGNKHSTEGARS